MHDPREVPSRLLNALMRLSARRAKTTYWLQMAVSRLGAELVNSTEVLDFVNYSRLVNDPLIYVDLGARGGVSPQLNALRSLIKIVLFEPDPEEFQALVSHNVNDPGTLVFPYAIGGKNEPKALYLTRKRACSSLLEPHGFMSELMAASVNGANEEYGSATRFDVERVETVECRTLATALEDKLSGIDILKIDTQGLEFEILHNLGNFRPYAINVECSTTDIYKNQKTIFEVGGLLRSLGYFPVSLMESHLVPKTHATVRRPIPLHGDCLFVPDLSPLGQEMIFRDPLKWLISLGVYGHLDLALWQSSSLSINLSAVA
jgi:FkbM family methyltransferase